MQVKAVHRPWQGKNYTCINAWRVVCERETTNIIAGITVNSILASIVFCILSFVSCTLCNDSLCMNGDLVILALSSLA